MVAPSVGQVSKTHGETGLVGVKLYDTGMRLLTMYGNPDQILPIGDSGRVGGGAGGGGRGGARGGAALAAEQYIRWVYNRDGCRYGFILDKNNRVVQIEAIGIENKKVHTKRGIGFGDTFKDVMERYQVPEGYQISG